MLAPRALTLALALLSLAVGTQAAAASDRVGSRIVGGEVAPAGAWPSIAAVLDRSVPSGLNAQFCGGTLIAPTVVLTAAHCVFNNSHTLVSPTAIDVAVGFTSLSAISAPERIALQSAPVGIVPFPSYDSAARNYVDDLALLNLASASAATPMPVIRSGQERLLGADSPARVAGWGALEWLGAYPDELRQAIVPIVPSSQCETNYGSSIVSSVMLCAGYFDTGGTDSCQGDSGGPLTAAFDGTNTLVGATSWGFECARAGFPGVYTRLSAFRSWLLTQPGVSSYLNTLTATPTVTGLTNAGPEVTATWSVDPANWSLTGFSTAIAGNTEAVDGGTLARSVSVPEGGEIGVAITSTVSLGSGATATFTGTPTPTRAPIVTASIAGVAKAGETLTATGSSDDPWAPTVSFQWLRDGTPIAGATAAAYTTSTADIGKTLSARTTATNAAGTGEAVATTAKIAAAPSVRVTTTKTLGLRRQGGVLHVTTPTATGYPTPKVTYQWQRNGKSIRKATKSTYRLTAADRGKKVRVRISYTNEEGSAEVRSASVTIRRTTTAFLPVPITRRVSISGTAKVGQRLRVTAPPAAGYTTPTTTYRWLRNGKPIGKATRNVYRLTAADRNRTISVRISYRNPVGTTTLTTRGVRVS